MFYGDRTLQSSQFVSRVNYNTKIKMLFACHGDGRNSCQGMTQSRYTMHRDAAVCYIIDIDDAWAAVAACMCQVRGSNGVNGSSVVQTSANRQKNELSSRRIISPSIDICDMWQCFACPILSYMHSSSAFLDMY